MNASITEALSGSPSLAAAQQTLLQSEDLRRAGYGVFFPQVSASAGANRERLNPLQFGSHTPPSVFSVFTLSAVASYVIDLFGAERRRMEVLGAEVDVSREDARAAYLTLTANVVSTSIARAAYEEEITATRSLIGAATEELRITEAQFEAGRTPYAGVAAARADLASLTATLPPLRLRAEQATHLLSVLAGHAPAEWQPQPIQFEGLTMPTELPLVVPSLLVRRRPDIRAAEATLHAASAEVGVATANLFPQVSLSAQIGSSAAQLADLPSPQGKFWSAGIDITQPIFSGGALWYSHRAAIDAYRASLEKYRETVLAGLGQVADSLRALEHDAEAVAAQVEADGDALESLTLVQANYAAGTADYVAVLAAQRARQSTRLAVLQARALQLQDTVVFFVALGGDWAVQSPAAIEGRR